MVRCSTLGLTAIATGASCSLAWYIANSTASLVAVNHVGSVDTAVAGNISGINVTIGYNAVTATSCDLTNDEGEVHYYLGSVRNASGTPRATGTFTFSANWGTATPADKALMEGHTYKVFISGEANARVLSSASATAVADDESSGGLTVYVKCASATLTVSFDDDSGVGASVTVNYAVRTNNASGLEYMKDNDANVAWGQPVKANNSGSLGEATLSYAQADDAGYTGSKQYEVMTKSGTWGVMTPRTFLHDADKIAVSAGTQVA